MKRISKMGKGDLLKICTEWLEDLHHGLIVENKLTILNPFV